MREKAWLAGALAAEHRAAGPGQHSSFRTAILDIRVWVFALIYFGVVIGLYGITMWLPQIFKGYGGLSNFQTGLLDHGAVFAGRDRRWLMGRAFGHGPVSVPGMWPFRPACGRRRPDRQRALLSFNPTLDFIALTVAAIGIYVVIPVFWTLPTKVLTGTAAAGGIALINAVGNIGGYAGPALVGYVRETTQNYADALLTLAAFAFLAGILAVVIGRNVSRAGSEADWQNVSCSHLHMTRHGFGL